MPVHMCVYMLELPMNQISLKKAKPRCYAKSPPGTGHIYDACVCGAFTFIKCIYNWFCLPVHLSGYVQLLECNQKHSALAK